MRPTTQLLLGVADEGGNLVDTMMTNATSEGSSTPKDTTGGILMVLAINFAVLLLGILLFWLWRACTDQKLYAGKPMTLWQFLRTPLADFEGVSADTYLYLQYVLDLFWFVFLFACLGCIVLLPLNVTFGKINHISLKMEADFSATTMKNIPPTSMVLWVHIVASVLASLGLVVLVYIQSNRVWLYRQGEERLRACSHVVFIQSGLPGAGHGRKPPVWRPALKKAIEQWINDHHLGPVRAVILYDNTEVRKLRKKLLRLEEALIRERWVHRAGDSMGDESHPVPCCARALPGTLCCPSFTGCKRQGCCCIPRPCCGAIGGTYSEMLDSLETQIASTKTELALAIDRADRPPSHEGSKQCNGRGLLVFGSPVAARAFVNAWRHMKFNRSTTKVHLRERGAPTPGDPPFEEFVDIQAGAWQLRQAPEPDDVNWRHMAKRETSRRWLGILSTTLLVLLMISLTSPLVLLTAAGDETKRADDEQDNKQDDQSSFDPRVAKAMNVVVSACRSLSPVAANLLLEYLPTLMLVMTGSFILWILQMVTSRLSPHLSGAETERTLIVTAFWFLFFNSVLLPTLVLSSLFVLIETVLHNRDPILVLSNVFVHGGGSLFVSYLLQIAFFGNAMDLFCPAELLIGWWRKLRAVTPKEKKKAREDAPFEFWYHYAYTLVAFSIVMIFGILVPLVLPAGVLYFALKFNVDKYRLLVVQQQQYVKLERVEEPSPWFFSNEEMQPLNKMRRGRKGSTGSEPVLDLYDPPQPVFNARLAVTAVRMLTVVVLLAEMFMFAYFAVRPRPLRWLALGIVLAATLAGFLFWYYNDVQVQWDQRGVLVQGTAWRGGSAKTYAVLEQYDPEEKIAMISREYEDQFSHANVVLSPRSVESEREHIE